MVIGFTGFTIAFLSLAITLSKKPARLSQFETLFLSQKGFWIVLVLLIVFIGLIAFLPLIGRLNPY